MRHALEAGRALLAAKKGIAHGEWLPWLRKHCEFSPRMAQNYMRLARSHKSLGQEDAKRVSHLSVRSALRFLSSTGNDDSGEERISDVHFSSSTDRRNTSELIINRSIQALGAIDLDPCSDNADSPNVPARRCFTEAEDGLAHEWCGRVFVNPPYGRAIGEWTRRLDESYQRGTVTEALALVPARTDAQWFSALRTYPRCFISGRLRFGEARNFAPFPSAVFYLGPRVERFARVFGELGDVFTLWSPD